jgi:hypothetical protein
MSDYDYLGNMTARMELLGMPNIMSSFSQFVSAPRVNMFNHHLSQTMILNNPEFNRTFTGQEHNLMDYQFNSSKRDFDCEIVAVIPKYRSPLIRAELYPEIYVIVLTDEPNGVKRLDYFTISRYFKGTNDFGFVPIIENGHRIRPGEWLDKDMVITRSPAKLGNRYGLGVNLNTAYGTFPETVEDAFIISRSAADRLETTQVSERVINCRMDRRPLNINGDIYENKFLPDIGSMVRSDGALCAFRPVHWSTVVADSDPEALREILPLQDEVMYIEPGSTIVDLTFNVNSHKPTNLYDQVRKYEENNSTCWEDIFTTYMKYKGQHKLTAKMSTLITTAMYRMIAQGSSTPALAAQFGKAMRNFEPEGVNGHPIDFLQVIVTYTCPRYVSNGSKLTDYSGSKGVVGAIYPDDWMPVDEDGMRADLWIDMNSPVARNNPSQFYEVGVNRIQEFVRRECGRVYEVKGSEASFETLMDWYHDINPNYEKLIREECVTPDDRKKLVREAIDSGVHVFLPPFLDTLSPSEDDTWNALENMQRWAQKWNVKPSRIRYKSLQADGTGKEFISRELFSIGSKYVIQLHKIPEIFAPGPASVNHIGVPTKSSSDESKFYPVTVNPYRFGEDEHRMMAMDASIREVTRLQGLQANSPLGVTKVIQTMLLSERPSNIERIQISNGELFLSNAVTNLFHNTTATLGVETKSTKIDGFDIPLELTNSIWNTDILDGPQFKMSDDGELALKRRAAKRSKIKKMVDSMADDESDLPLDDATVEIMLDPEEESDVDVDVDAGEDEE